MNMKISEQQLWALAVGDALLRGNGLLYEHDYDMKACEVDPELRRVRVLKEGWGITDEESALRVIGSLREHGHHSEFDQLRRMLSVMTLQQQDEYRMTLQDNYQIAETKVVQRYAPLLPPSGILAWDMGRAAFLYHLCYEVGYLTYKQAWIHLLQNAIEVQAAYSSWEEFGTAYIIGRQFWDKELDGESTINHLRYVEEQLSDPDHLWNTLPWDLKLEPWG